MKIQFMFKDPYAVSDAVDDAVRAEVDAIAGLDADERADVFETRRDKVNEIVNGWFHYGEYCTVILDTEAGTATVVKQDK